MWWTKQKLTSTFSKVESEGRPVCFSALQLFYLEQISFSANQMHRMLSDTTEHDYRNYFKSTDWLHTRQYKPNEPIHSVMHYTTCFAVCTVTKCTTQFGSNNITCHVLTAKKQKHNSLPHPPSQQKKKKNHKEKTNYEKRDHKIIPSNTNDFHAVILAQLLCVVFNLCKWYQNCYHNQPHIKRWWACSITSGGDLNCSVTQTISAGNVCARKFGSHLIKWYTSG